MNLGNQRRDYKKSKLLREDLKDNPFEQFIDWLNDAYQTPLIEPTAMTVSTVSKEGKPSLRVVLLKEVSQEVGFVFYSNYLSRKGQEIEDNPQVSLLFYWDILERQVRIEGTAKKVNEEKSAEYFNSRPLGSRISAIVSPQSQVITDKAALEKQSQFLQENKEQVTKPNYWGGYAVEPNYFEFWQGRERRFHDRFAFSLLEFRKWRIEQLAP